MPSFTDPVDYKKRDNWSVDRIKFEIEEIDKVYPLLTEKYKKLEETRDWCSKMIQEHKEEGLDISRDLSIRMENIQDKMNECENLIRIKSEKRGALVDILRSRL
ncbi:MAG: hypothetical protein V7K27_33275 [Nostoc sp.]|uniref:hypothetical protein n=1 Tax=Nostoc sp. TaxID=1180 RepID=UPI002FF8C15A